MPEEGRCLDVGQRAPSAGASRPSPGRSAGTPSPDAGSLLPASTDGHQFAELSDPEPCGDKITGGIVRWPLGHYHRCGIPLHLSPRKQYVCFIYFRFIMGGLQ